MTPASQDSTRGKTWPAVGNDCGDRDVSDSSAATLGEIRPALHIASRTRTDSSCGPFEGIAGVVHGIADLGDYRNREFPTRRERNAMGIAFRRRARPRLHALPVAAGFLDRVRPRPDRAARDRRSQPRQFAFKTVGNALRRVDALAGRQVMEGCSSSRTAEVAMTRLGMGRLPEPCRPRSGRRSVARRQRRAALRPERHKARRWCAE